MTLRFMNSSNSDEREFAIAGVGHVLFAAILIWLGLLGFRAGDFAPVWQPAPKWVPMHTPLAYLCAFISLASGIGLLWKRSAAIAARVIFVSFAVWLLVMRLPNLVVQKPLVLAAWPCGCIGVMLAAAWVLHAWFGGIKGIRIARVVYGLSLIPFGLAHFLYVDATTVLIPNWLPWHTALAYGTGATFIAAGLAIVAGVVARWAVTLSTLQFGLFGLIVWIPRVIGGKVTPFQWGEFVVTFALAAAGWVVMDSFRGEQH